MANAIAAACALSAEESLKASESAYENVRGYTWADAGNAFEAAIRSAVESAL